MVNKFFLLKLWVKLDFCLKMDDFILSLKECVGICFTIIIFLLYFNWKIERKIK